MSGIYIHVPFCRKACTYCDFHFSTSVNGRTELLNAMSLELELRKNEVREPVSTIYFGGGTPSLLDPFWTASTIEKCRTLFNVTHGAEITLEANPDDITKERLEQWISAGVTRMSMGTQSFREDRLEFMGRAHTAAEAMRGIELISKAGFASWTIDLIYGLPGMDLKEWDEQLTIALDHGMPHLSAYCLTVEPRTALAHQVQKGTVQMPDDDAQSAQFDHLMERMEAAGLDHYEISNFGKPEHWSRHNTSYWQGVPYLGIGPSAHSFNGADRRWNVANNARYVKAIGDGSVYWESETLTSAQRTNELLMTGLRTSSGVDLSKLEKDPLTLNSSAINAHVSKGHLILSAGRLVLSRAGRHFADRIASDLFVPEDDR